MPARPRHDTTPALETDAYPDPATLNSILTTENLALSSYAMMTVLHEAAGPMQLVTLAQRIGYSYWAVRNQILRTTYFTPGEGHRRKNSVTASLTPEGHEKLARVHRRIAAGTGAVPVKPRRRTFLD